MMPKKRSSSVKTRLGWSNGDLAPLDNKVRSKLDKNLLEVIEAERKPHAHSAFVKQVKNDSMLGKRFMTEKQAQKMARVLYNIDRRLESAS